TNSCYALAGSPEFTAAFQTIARKNPSFVEQEAARNWIIRSVSDRALSCLCHLRIAAYNGRLMPQGSWRYGVQAALLAGLLTPPQATHLSAQQPEPTFRGGVNLVTLDVIPRTS